ncbi:AAA family ATPase [Olivibacter domesticus]|uniref:MoxR-like ATPase n=1 Tax=Olivibacter domesticus TaxID=407022 RepID=A0A1H7TGH6_OLID1|nr:MoxR family ATPase [Olivibacter domesticus]SEL83514.1 MoxR-like ATPase [Olivibacter domesticus]
MEQEFFERRTDLTELNEAVRHIKEALSQIIVGQQEMIELLIAAILADGHVLIEGVPGVAKTLTAKLIAKCIDAQFSRIQFTPDLMPSDVLGTSIFNPQRTDFEFRRGPIFGNIILVDEINRAPAKTQSALFEVMEERQITMDGNCYKMEEPFMVLATQNPIEQEGTYRLPEAQLDRFLFKIEVGYPSLVEETDILAKHHQHNTEEKLLSLSPILNITQIKMFRLLTKNLHVEDKLLEFVAKIVYQTRNNKSLFLGGSPRASLAIINSAKAIAAMNSRDFVTPDDITKVALPVLRHRVMLTPEKEMEGITADDVINQIIKNIEIPR